MMYIVGKDGKISTWHIGEDVPSVKEVVEIQADGDELDLITRQVSGIPMLTSPVVVRWFGETAIFIWHNLIWKR
jgi:hypothetical protein